LHITVESEVHDAFSEEDLPNLLAAEKPNGPNANPFKPTRTVPVEGTQDSNADLMLGLSKEK
jgi:hypothetical protein